MMASRSSGSVDLSPHPVLLQPPNNPDGKTIFDWHMTGPKSGLCPFLSLAPVLMPNPLISRFKVSSHSLDVGPS
jgi:hypothetical protein